MRLTTARGARAALAGALVAATMIGLVVCIAGGSPAMLAVAGIASASTALATRMGWRVGLPLSVVALLALSAVLVRVAPLLGSDLFWSAAIGLTVIGLAGGIIVAAGRSALPIPSRRELVVALAALVVPVGFLVLTTIAFGTGAGMHVGWAMNNDTAWNTVSSRLILADGGIASWSTPNPSPLANGLMALWYAPGRPELGSLQHDVARQTELLLLMTAMASTFAGLLTARGGIGRRIAIVVVGGVIGGLIPLTWFVSGYVIQFGFFNVVPVIVVMLAAWMLWTVSNRHPVLATVGLLISTLVLFASWAPVAALPAALALVAAIRGWIHGAKSPGAVVSVGAAGALLVGYVVLVTLPDLRRSGHALAANGAAPASTFIGFIAAVAIVIGIAAVAAFVRARRTEALGVVVLAVASLGVVAYLVGQRAGQPELWGYYPAKFAWIVGIVFAVIAAAGTFAWVGSHRTRTWRVVPVAVAASAIAILTAATVSPTSPSVSGVFPLLGLIRHPEAGDHQSELLFSLADGGPTIAARLSDEQPWAESFANFWLLQLHSLSSEESIRSYAYFLDSGDVDEICSAVEAWDSDVRVVTRDEQLSSELEQACGGLPITVEVRE